VSQFENNKYKIRSLLFGGFKSNYILHTAISTANAINKAAIASVNRAIVFMTLKY